MPRKKKQQDSEILKEQEEIILVEDVVLGYEHLSQNGPTANYSRNDCGAACVAILARGNGFPELTVDGVAAAWMDRNKPMYVHQVQRALKAFKMPNKRQQPLYAADIEKQIREVGLPAVLLVHYPSMPNQAIKYRFSHYVVAYGVKADGSILYFDPLGDGSETLEVSQKQLDQALYDTVKDGNQPHQGILLI